MELEIEDFDRNYTQLALDVLIREGASSVQLVVIALSGDDETPPFTDMVAQAPELAGEMGIGIRTPLWARLIDSGEVIRSYDDPDYVGIIRAPEEQPVYREEFGGQISPQLRSYLMRQLEPGASQTVLDERTSRIFEALEVPPHRMRHALLAAIEDSRKGLPIAFEADLVLVGAAFPSPLHYCHVAPYLRDDDFVMTLLRNLVRDLPGRFRANPAAMLALWQMLRGRLDHANVSVGVCFDAEPENPIGHLLNLLGRTGTSVEQLWSAICSTSEEQLSSSREDDS
ncbi:DUF4192 family protein [Sciscionella marina]|uniref:DUF4192 family protein n=1 Tax=Sciscionella marina TaxID=508770 RepID=UPI0012F6C61F|nr:DUF4192 family protein [Sciscionella marina]